MDYEKLARDIKAAAHVKHYDPIDPQTWIIEHVFIENDYYGDDNAERDLVNAMRGMDEIGRLVAASDYYTEYLNARGIRWGSAEVLTVTWYRHGNGDGGHYVIRAMYQRRA